MPLGIGKTEYKISFDDIRKVIPTLDNIIINDWWNGKYKIEKGVKNTMLYVGYGTLLHKKISERLFVLKPWTDIEPNYKLPQLNKTISYLISQLDMNSNVIRLYGKSL